MKERCFQWFGYFSWSILLCFVVIARKSMLAICNILFKIMKFPKMKGAIIMLKKFMICVLNFMLFFAMATSNVSAATVDYAPSDSLMEYVSDLHSTNVRYSVFDSMGQNVTTSFDIATQNMSNSQICNYMHENVLMISKYYVSDIQLASVGGTDTFTHWYGGYAMDRNNMFEAEIQFELTCTVTWDSSYGIYNGSCYMKSGTFKCTNFNNPTVMSDSYDTTITSNRKKITYTYEMTFGLEVPGKVNPVFYDFTHSFSWSC